MFWAGTNARTHARTHAYSYIYYTNTFSVGICTLFFPISTLCLTTYEHEHAVHDDAQRTALMCVICVGAHHLCPISTLTSHANANVPRRRSD